MVSLCSAGKTLIEPLKVFQTMSRPSSVVVWML